MVLSDWQFWVLMALALGIAEIFVSGVVLAWLAVGALGAAGASAIGAGTAVQFLVAAIIGGLSFVLLRPFAQNWFFNRKEVKTGVDALIGRTARVTQAFSPQSRSGRCKVDGDDWMAELEEGAMDVPDLAASVTVVGIESNTLIVQPTLKSSINSKPS
jgi:membrane protein implicated in regulation of membrane protease activity